MGARSSETAWRQSSVIATESAVALGLLREEEASTQIALVISHDCDLTQASDVEPAVELIVGMRVTEANGNYTHAKNPRRLHLYLEEDGKDSIIELQANAKVLVKKERLAQHVPDEKFGICANQHAILQAWLAARYRRAAFADEFERRLKAAKLHEAIAKILRPLGDDIVAIFFDVDEGRSAVERTEADDSYTLSISILYSTSRDPLKAETAATGASSKIKSAFEKACFISEKNVWQNIELLECEAISDEALTYAMAAQLKKWNLDYISLREKPDSTMVI